MSGPSSSPPAAPAATCSRPWRWPASCARRGQRVALMTDGRGARYVGDDAPCHLIVAPAARRGSLGGAAARPWPSRRRPGRSAWRCSRGMRPSAAACVRRLCLGAAGRWPRPRSRVPLLLHEQNAVLGRPTGCSPRFAAPRGAQLRADRATARRARAASSSPATRCGPASSLATRLRRRLARRAASVSWSSAAARARGAQRRRAGGGRPCCPKPAPPPADHPAMPAGGSRRGAGRLCGAWACRAELATFFARRAAAAWRQAHLVIAAPARRPWPSCWPLGRPALLVPYPHATDDHQRANAARAGRCGRRRVSGERSSELTAERLAAELAMLMRSRRGWRRMAGGARAAGAARCRAGSGRCGRWRSPREDAGDDGTGPSHVGPIHFVGIGGIGMSGIAEVMRNLGYTVQGSDIADSANVQRLRGARHPRARSATRPRISARRAWSSSPRRSSPTIRSSPPPARRRIPVVRRADMLAELMRLKRVDRRRRHARQDHDHRHGRRPARRRRARSDRGQWRHHQRLRHQRAARPGRLDGGRGRRERRQLPAPAGDVGRRHQHRPRAHGSLRQLRRGAGGLPRLRRAPAVLRLRRAVHRSSRRSRRSMARVPDRRIVTYGFSPQADVRALAAACSRPTASVFDVVVRDHATAGRARLERLRLPMPGAAQCPERAGGDRRRARARHLGEAAIRKALAGLGGRQAALHPHRHGRRRRRHRRLRPPSGRDPRRAADRTRRDRRGGWSPSSSRTATRGCAPVRRVLHLLPRRRHRDRGPGLCRRRGADRGRPTATRWSRACARHGHRDVRPIDGPDDLATADRATSRGRATSSSAWAPAASRSGPTALPGRLAALEKGPARHEAWYEQPAGRARHAAPRRGAGAAHLVPRRRARPSSCSSRPMSTIWRLPRGACRPEFQSCRWAWLEPAGPRRRHRRRRHPLRRAAGQGRGRGRSRHRRVPARSISAWRRWRSRPAWPGSSS